MSGSKWNLQADDTVTLKLDMNWLLENLSDTILVDKALDESRSRVVAGETLHTRAQS